MVGSFLLRQRELDAPHRLRTLGSRERAHSTPRISPERDLCPSKMYIRPSKMYNIRPSKMYGTSAGGLRLRGGYRMPKRRCVCSSSHRRGAQGLDGLDRQLRTYSPHPVASTAKIVALSLGSVRLVSAAMCTKYGKSCEIAISPSIRYPLDRHSWTWRFSRCPSAGITNLV